MNAIPIQLVYPRPGVWRRVASCQLPVASGLIYRRVNASLPARRGFTLIEVMISIAIALVLILGISQIFSMAQRTVGGGTQVLSAAEASRGVQEQLLTDARGITNAVGDSPGIALVSYSQAAFRSLADQQQTVSQKPYTYNDPANPGSSLNESVYAIDDHVHRTDVLGFFTRGNYTRRTGDSGPTGGSYPASLSSPSTSQEAFVWYGHLALPDNNMVKNWNYTNPAYPKPPSTGQYWNPGSGTATTNQNNFYASNWILGRQVTLLSLRSPNGFNYAEPHILGVSESPSVNPLWLPPTTTPNPPMSIAYGNVNPPIPFYSSRYDLADATIAQYRTLISSSAYVNLWWQGLSGCFLPIPPPLGTKTISAAPQQNRFQANPFLLKPVPAPGPTGTETQQLSAALAQLSPIFVRGCSQFIVEFAGDYMTQDANNYGAITSSQPDGQIDYIDVPDPATGQHTHQIRWYGFPRDTTGAGTPTWNNGGVLPVSSVFAGAQAAGQTATVLPNTLLFERTVPVMSQAWNTNTAAAGTANTALPAYTPTTSTNSVFTPYACAWGPDTDNPLNPRPKMLRITIAIDDPAGHLNTQQIYEYVLNLP